jgi:hypothetical protein
VSHDLLDLRSAGVRIAWVTSWPARHYLFSGTSLFVANLSNDLGNWLFLAKLGFIALAMINLELTRIYVFDRPAAAGATAATTALPKHSGTFAIAALVLWSLAMVAGRFTAYPNFVEAWLGF